MKRVQINSRDSSTQVNLKYPQIDPNKSYALYVEKLTVPATDSLILNQELFSIFRRVREGAQIPHVLGIEDEYTHFIPRDVHNLTDLLFQMNYFFKSFLARFAAQDHIDDEADNPVVYNVPIIFDGADEDWFNDLQSDPVVNLIQAVFRPDGRIGIKLAPDAMTMFVIEFSEEGQRIFNTKRWMALDENGAFDDVYGITGFPIAAGVTEADFDLPAVMPTSAKLFFMDNSIFSHIRYRHELVLLTSLPLNNLVSCEDDQTYYKRQLASYRFPDSKFQVGHFDTMFRKLQETRHIRYVFETTIKTHNVFKLRGTELQNFSIYLVDRNYVWDGTRYKLTETPYNLDKDTFYTVQFAVKQL